MATKLAVTKLAVLAALFAAMFVAASAFRTTVTTVVLEDNEENPSRRQGSRQQCQQQLQQQQQLSHCQQLLIRGGRLIALEMPGAEGEANPEQLQQCCQQLEQVQDQCRCQGIERIVEMQLQRGKLQGQRLREVIQTAENLPSMCNLSPQRCEISVRGSSSYGSDE